MIAAPLAQAQSPPTIHAEARVVQIEVIVTDSHGKPVTDLTKQDFTVVDEGKPRVVDIFGVNGGGTDRQTIAAPGKPASTTPGLPPRQPDLISNLNTQPPDLAGHSTAIVLDQVNAFLEDATYARDQVVSLMKKLPADERIAVYVIARKEGLVVLQDYTTDRALLIKSLKQYQPRALLASPAPPPSTGLKSGQAGGPGAGTAAAVSAFKAGGEQTRPPGLAPGILGPDEALTQWYANSAAARLSLQALSDHLALLPGRKSVFWVTQAFPSWVMKEKKMGSPPPMEMPAWNKTITALNEANVAVNVVDDRGIFRGSNPNEGTVDSMREIAVRTGGTAYFGRNDLDTAMEQGIEASRVTYTLGFYLADNERDGKYHTLLVNADRPGLQLLYRQGYDAGNRDQPATRKDDLDATLLNQADSKAVGITARVDSVVPGEPHSTINLHVNLSPSTVSLKEEGDSSTGTIEEMVVELDDRGATLSKVSSTKQFQVTAATRKQYETGGISWPESMPLMEGAKTMKIVVRDTKTGHVGSLTVRLD